MQGIAGTLHPARVLRLVALITPPLAVIAPRGLAILLPLAALLAAAGAWRAGNLPRLPAVPAGLLAAFALWGAASATWALHPALVWPVWAQIAALGIAGLALLGPARDSGDEARLRIGLALAAGVAVALALLFVEWASGLLFERSLGSLAGLRRPFSNAVFNRGAAVTAILVWPAAHALHLRYGRPAAAALVAAEFLVVAQFDSMAAILGLAAGGVVWLAASWRPRPTAIALAVAVAVGAAAAPVLPRTPVADAVAARRDIPSAIFHRLEIWRFTAEAVAERPLAGWGLNAARELPGGDALSASGRRLMPLHPHNFMLQWWLELGLVGAALATALLLAAIRGASRLGPSAQPSALATIASGCLIAATGYGIWQAWWMAALWIAAALMAAAAKGQARG